MISYNQKQLRDLSFSSAKEWLLTDGDGGFACSTVSFMNTRRQHSLLTISTNTPLKRLTLLNKVDEEIIIEGKSYFIGTNQYPGTIFPEGYKLLSKFTFDYFPQVTFDLDGCQLTKKILMPKRSNSVFIHYDNNSKKEITLRLLPLLSFRWKDSLQKAGDGFLVDELPDGVRVIADLNLPRLYLKLSQIYATSPASYWYYSFIYPHDADLYEEDREDLYNIGYWETQLEPGKGVTFAASVRDLAEFSYDEIESRHIESINSIRAASGLPKKYIHLADIASNHIVRSKAIRSSTIIEGYPYGSIAMRETFLSLDGISYVSADKNYEYDLLHDLVTNEVNGTLPSAINEMTHQVNYDDPEMPFYFAIALARCAEKEKSLDCVRPFLPILEETIEITTGNNLAVFKLKDSHLLETIEKSQSGPAKAAKEASANALWYNLLRLVGESKSAIGSLPEYSETAAEIETHYFQSFFNQDGSYKDSNDHNEVTIEMVMPLVVPYSPLNEAQRSKLCKILTSKFFRTVDSQSAHESPNHACNLVAIYLTEATSQLKDCADEFERLKEFLEKLLGLQDYTNCVSGLPKCGKDATEHYPQNLSSSVMAGEAIRIVKKLKLK